jgi:hypothetical protein
MFVTLFAILFVSFPEPTRSFGVADPLFCIFCILIFRDIPHPVVPGLTPKTFIMTLYAEL